MSKLDRLTLFILHPGPDDRERRLCLTISEKRVHAKNIWDDNVPDVDRPVYGYEWSIARDLMLELASASATIAELKEEVNELAKRVRP